jgi:hypothetical protein
MMTRCRHNDDLLTTLVGKGHRDHRSGRAELMAQRIQRRRTKGWRMPPGAVYVGRPTRWGNPFRGAEAVPQYAAWFPTSGLDYRELRGRSLVCWCPLSQACHADILLQIANQEDCQS